MMSQMGSLGIENKELSETMAAYDKVRSPDPGEVRLSRV
jgi:hypothetical protein